MRYRLVYNSIKENAIKSTHLENSKSVVDELMLG